MSKYLQGQSHYLNCMDDNCERFACVARRDYERQLANKDSLIQELASALKNFENDDGSVPKTIWDERNAVLEKTKQE